LGEAGVNDRDTRADAAAVTLLVIMKKINLRTPPGWFVGLAMILTGAVLIGSPDMQFGIANASTFGVLSLVFGLFQVFKQTRASVTSR
jgi:hypothetical protein